MTNFKGYKFISKTDHCGSFGYKSNAVKVFADSYQNYEELSVCLGVKKGKYKGTYTYLHPDIAEALAKDLLKVAKFVRKAATNPAVWKKRPKRILR